MDAALFHLINGLAGQSPLFDQAVLGVVGNPLFKGVVIMMLFSVICHRVARRKPTSAQDRQR